MDPQQTIVQIALAAIAATIVTVVGRALRRETPAWTVGIAMAVALFWNFNVQEGFPAWPLTAKWHSILLVAAGLAIMVAAMAWLPRALRDASTAHWLTAIITAAIVGFALRLPTIDDIAPQHIAMFGLPPLVLVLAPIAAKKRGFGVPAACSLCFAALAGLCLQGGLAKFGILSGGIGAALGAIAVLSSRWPTGLSGAALAGVLGLLAAFAASGAAYYERQFPIWLWAVPVAAPLTLLVTRCNAIQERPRLAAVLGVALPALVAIAAVAFTFALAPTQASDATDAGNYGAYGR